LPATLVDTNVLVYAHDPRDRRKQTAAADVLDILFAAERVVISVQCMTEFFSAVRRLPEAMSAKEALDQIEQIARASRIVEVTAVVTFEALRGVQRHGLSVWDALIWSAAKLNQIPYVLTEDAPRGRVLEGVRYLDPFDPAFDPLVLSA